MITDPDFKGEWTPKMIENPEYKGNLMIANPDFKDDAAIGVYDDIRILAFELWQVNAGTIFDIIPLPSYQAIACVFSSEVTRIIQNSSGKGIRVTHEIDDLRKFDDLDQDGCGVDDNTDKGGALIPRDAGTLGKMHYGIAQSIKKINA
tara:strand:- start:805 stop:1248 length:444 start_codon:yes stop_codon:yes gene_type:complete